MRLWHIDMISVLPRQQLLGQHRECCALRGLCWGRKHSIIDYVFLYDWEFLYNYHMKVIAEMKKRGYKPNPIWLDYTYRGKRCKKMNSGWIIRTREDNQYPEHNRRYLIRCVELLIKKIEKAKPRKYNENEIYKLYTWIEERRKKGEID